jgi:hypothetical protein
MYLRRKFILFFFGALILSNLSCHKKYKYPENTYKGDPTKLKPFNGKLTHYVVNGVDSLTLLNAYYGNFNGIVKDISQSRFFTDEFSSHTRSFFNVGSSLNIDINYNFIDKNRKMTINMYRDTALFKKNLFIDSNVEWEIVRLSNSGPFKIRTDFNNNKYEIQIN